MKNLFATVEILEYIDVATIFHRTNGESQNQWGDDIPRELTPNVHVCIMPLMVVVLRHVIGRGAARE